MGLYASFRQARPPFSTCLAGLLSSRSRAWLTDSWRTPLDGDATTTEWREAGFKAASEAGAFFAVTAGVALAQAALGITTRAPPVAALATLASCSVGAVAASYAGGGQFQFEQPTIDDALRAAACGVTAYAILGGRPTSLAPSHLASVGAFGRRKASWRRRATTPPTRNASNWRL